MIYAVVHLVLICKGSNNTVNGSHKASHTVLDVTGSMQLPAIQARIVLTQSLC